MAMAVGEPNEWVRHYQCRRKVRFATEGQAERRAGQLRHAEGVRLWVYACPWCGHWHLTHLPQPYHERIEE